eukprot:214620-Rhodomonas_salina.2
MAKEFEATKKNMSEVHRTLLRTRYAMSGTGTACFLPFLGYVRYCHAVYTEIGHVGSRSER